MNTEDNYYLYLENRRKTNQRIKDCRRELHKEYLQSNKLKLRVLDIAMIMVILFNFGALVITNALVVKVNPTEPLMEANPIQSKMNGYVQNPRGAEILNALLKQAVIWFILIGAYLHLRYNIFKERVYYAVFGLVLFYVILTSLDFFNDFGFWIGRMMFG